MKKKQTLLRRDDFLDFSRNPVAQFVNFNIKRGKKWPDDFDVKSIEYGFTVASQHARKDV